MKPACRSALLLLIVAAIPLYGGCSGPATPDVAAPTPTASEPVRLAQAGETLTTYVDCPENGLIAVRIDVPPVARYGDSAPVVVVASTWFVEKYNRDEVGFHLVYNPVDVGAITVAHLWPGKTDPQTQASSQGVYDYGGPDSLAALRDTLRFALGEIPDRDGRYLHQLIGVQPLYDNVGMFASSHAGVVATNVMAYHGQALTGLRYFVGRENPTMAEMYPLEIGHFDDRGQPVYNPYYDHRGYTPTGIAVDYTHLGWVQNADYPKGRPVFKVPGGTDYVLDDKGPIIEGKRHFSHALTQALMDNGVFNPEKGDWPEDVATPAKTRDFWPYRTPVGNYAAIGEALPDLKVLLSFASRDHVQAAPDKPHIRQAYDGFRKTAGLWTRLNCDLAYVQAEIHPGATLAGGFPDNDVNTEPSDWYAEAASWGFAGKLAGEMTARTVPLAGVAEMADRVQAGNWESNLAAPLLPSSSSLPLPAEPSPGPASGEAPDLSSTPAVTLEGVAVDGTCVPVDDGVTIPAEVFGQPGFEQELEAYLNAGGSISRLPDTVASTYAGNGMRLQIVGRDVTGDQIPDLLMGITLPYAEGDGETHLLFFGCVDGRYSGEILFRRAGAGSRTEGLYAGGGAVVEHVGDLNGNGRTDVFFSVNWPDYGEYFLAEWHGTQFISLIEYTNLLGETCYRIEARGGEEVEPVDGDGDGVYEIVVRGRKGEESTIWRWDGTQYRVTGE